MVDARRRFGDTGEEHAAHFLLSLGHQILARQWRSPFGEIDLVSLDPNGGKPEVVFVEVKTRRSLESGFPEDSVTPAKLRHLAANAECFLEERQWEERQHRFDVIAIIETETGEREILHLKGV